MLWYRLLVTATAAAAFVPVVLGAVVRVSGSGLGCPDWPRCHGRFVPPSDLAALLEYSHRVSGAVLAVLVLAVCAAAWARYRGRLDVVVPATLVLPLVAVTAALGAVIVRLELPPMLVLLHLTLALSVLGLLVWLATGAWLTHDLAAPVRTGSRPHDEKLAVPALHPDQQPVPPRLGLASLAAAAVFAVILSGAYVRATGATLACRTLPDCGGLLLPSGGDRLVDIHLAHRLLAAAAGLLIATTLVLVYRRRRQHPGPARAAAALACAYSLQVGLGLAGVVSGQVPLTRGLHVAGAAATWAAAVAYVAVTWAEWRPTGGQRPRLRALAGAVGSPRRTVAAYLALTKPRILVLLLLTTLCSMLVAGSGIPAMPLIVLTLGGGALAAGGANAINCYLDRDIDRLMSRTHERPIPMGVIPPRGALLFGIVLAALSFLMLALWVNLLAAALAQAALLFYVLVYTLWLKRRSPHNIVIGGAAGAMPPLVAWAAVRGDVGLLAIYLFAIIFYWTPPHFWALALRLKPEYERARVPMLPVVRGDRETRWQILLYSVVLVVLTLLLFATRMVGGFYLLSATVLGGLFLYYAVRLWRDATTSAAGQLFRYSIAYLALLFVALALDASVLTRPSDTGGM